MTAFVPATTAVRRNRVGNIDTDRLLRRRDHLIGDVLVRFMGPRIDFALRAAELHAIEDELLARSVPIQRHTWR